MYDYFTFLPTIFLLIYQPQKITRNDLYIHKRGYPSSYLIRANIYVKFGQIGRKGFFKKEAMLYPILCMLPRFSHLYTTFYFLV